MRNSTRRAGVGRHRKITTSQTTKGRIAFVALASGAVSSAGVGGAAAATLSAETPGAAVSSNVELVNHAEELSSAADGLSSQGSAAADSLSSDMNGSAASLSSDVDGSAAALSSDANALSSNVGSSSGDIAGAIAMAEQAVPQILAIAEYKPVTGLIDQLDKAVSAAEQRLANGIPIGSGSAVRPAAGAYTSGYGPRWGTFHHGIDIAGPVGTPIYSVMNGTVINSGPASGYGNWIRIRHDDGSMAVYGHMVSLDVSVGQRVSAGQKIAGMGNEGHSTGSHLHFEIHPTGNGAVDPIPWFAQRGVYIS